MLNLMLFFRAFFRSTFLIGVFSSVMCGCTLTVPSAQDAAENQSTVDDKPVPAGEIWHQLALAVKRRTITRTTQLAQIVLVLVKNGNLSDADAAKFDAAFPTVTTADRDLTDADAVLLGGLK